MTLPYSVSRRVLCSAFALICGLICSVAAEASSLAANPSTLQFGQVVVGKTETLSAKVTNTGSSSMTVWRIVSHISTYTVSTASLPLTLAPGSSTAVSVTFTPSTTGSSSGVISINHGSVYLDVSGTGTTSTPPPSVSASPASLSFGSVQDGSSSSQSITLKNTGSGSATISQASATTGFAAQGLSLPLTLTSGQSYTFTIAFDPSSSGSDSGTFTALSSSGSTLVSVPLSGTGTAPGSLSLSPTSASFGSVNVGSTSSKSGTLTASGSSVTITSAGSSSAEFVLSGITLPTTIAAGSSASYSVTFKPQSSGAASGSVSFASNASDATLAESVSGTGVATTPPVTHSVSLSWDASTSKVAGYNVYRGSNSGGPYTKLNSSEDTATNYVDSSVEASTTYYYVTTAVNSSGQESGYSNQVTAAVP